MLEQVKDFCTNSVFFGVFISLTAYLAGTWIHKKTKFFLFSPLLVSTTICILILLALKIPYEKYLQGANLIHYLLTPATVCLAIPLYVHFEKLKNNWKAIIGGITAGVLTNLTFIFAMCVLFKIQKIYYVSMLPKSITTAIAVSLTNELGGLVPITIMMVIITGNLGNLFAEQICRIFKITDSVAKGVAIGTSSHALGTAKAIQMGEVEGAMSGLSIAVTGLITVVGASVFAQFIK